MSIPDWLRKENVNDSSGTIDPEVKRAIQRYKDHFGEFDIEMVHFRPFEETIKIIDYCKRIDKRYQELFPRDPDAIAY